MDRFDANVQSLIARRAIHNVNQADTIVAVAYSGLQQEVSSLNSMQIARENMSAAGNAIRDVDFAVEVSHLTRVRLLVSSSSSLPQLVNARPRVRSSAHCQTGRAEGCDPLLPPVSFDLGSVVGQ